MVGSIGTALVQQSVMLTLRVTLYSQLGAELLEGDAVTVLVDDTVAGLWPSVISPSDRSKHLHTGHNQVW